MSQQTTLAVVLARFLLFVQELPNVHALANCSDEQLRSLWTGLGYYARARNLKKGALHIVNVLGGEFPATFDDWKQIPGCGNYTAGMLASICNAQRIAAVDGNVTRVAARVLGLREEAWQARGQERIYAFAQACVLESSNPGDCNQALIELGALLCRKHNPECIQCPFNQACVAFLTKTVSECPSPKPRRTKEKHSVFPVVIVVGNKVAFFTRARGFLKTTDGFVLVRENHLLADLESRGLCNRGTSFGHVITHHQILATPCLLRVPEKKWASVKTLLGKQGFVFSAWLFEKDVDAALQTSLDTKAWAIVKLLT